MNPRCTVDFNEISWMTLIGASLSVMKVYTEALLRFIITICDCKHPSRNSQVNTRDVLEGLRALSEQAAASFEIYPNTGDNVVLEGQWKEVSNDESQNSGDDSESEDESDEDEDEGEEDDAEEEYFQPVSFSKYNEVETNKLDISRRERLAWVRNIQRGTKLLMNTKSFYEWMMPIATRL